MTAAEPSRRDRDAVTLALDALRAMIATGQIEPGTELSQVSLAKAIGVSTTPLREALRRLESEGLVEARRNRSPRVPPFDPADLDAVYGHRIAVEPLAVALAVPRLRRDQLDAQDQRLSRMRRAANLTEWDALHDAFHADLVAPHSTPLRDELARLMARSERYRRMAVRGDGSPGRQAGEGEHEQILAACRTGDAAVAGELLARHLARSALSVVAHLAPDFDPLTVRGALQMVLAWAGR